MKHKRTGGVDMADKQAASKFRKLREKRGLTITDVARKLGLSHTAVSKWDSGEGYPRMKRLQELSRVLKCKPADLI
jgi:transcriptional regulator with XRE-family HTH domain